MSLTGTQRKRLEQRFDLYDINEDGRIDRTDLEREAQRIVRAFGEHESSPRAQALLHAYPQMFDYLVARADLAAGSSMTKEQFVGVAEREMLRHGAAGFGKVLRPSIRAMVDLCDIDGDGQVNPAEFRRWLEAISGDIDAARAFEAIDANGDGQLSVDELVTAVGLYHEGKQDAPLLGV
ncbi:MULTISPECIES: EF-hand domain-containing protein [Streptomyces]|jgi:Ca2+-binding EF-hand superfamily protein|uniref:Calcium binding protein n=3 Tax=Streptomyces griseoaurantiacus TaxID=68213 RepID=F3NH35_9ACTN|nr:MULTISPECIES: EF-hand domain-containing protein [Streptomyces]EGG47162.1 calcium binding protein [Streptomyces griseoaurantiacus M045]MBA5223956.1 EF-hand domain-containing protein [Streptomyces griseoaurantiacus]MCF0086817.1 Calerythrin [Streptomyces sp. MH192]MCF0099491.1 Calerythrin [Streptomyces sp. MH191]MDX3361314.1 EF-hand domain-containing protein [Streptomyces sp. ME02-6978.2a]